MMDDHQLSKTDLLRMEAEAIKCRLGELHKQLIELDMLNMEYGRLWNRYMAIDAKLAEIDGRLKICKPRTSGKKAETELVNKVKVMDKPSIEALITLLQAEMKEMKEE